MPIYTYECETCKVKEEHIVKMEERDSKKILCGICARKMKRLMDLPTIGKPGYQMQAVLSDGSKVKGHFGKAAKIGKRGN